ncbi:MAG TPA: VOC family protein [Candidatus Binataceae bacterium]|nr:VOC family protein [Candidatus Binataceae bacterium]
MDTKQNRPLRLHHNAWVVRDQRATRHFYEDIIGIPMVACWNERDEVFGGMRVYCHTFYQLADGGALAFFQFEDPRDYERFGPQFRPTPFIHIALKTTAETQQAIAERLAAADIEHFFIEHGYCCSLYVTDPDGLNLEFTVDDPRAEQINAERLRTRDADLERWLRGDHSSNNNWRRENT